MNIEAKEGFQAAAVEVLTPQEEATLNYIKEGWEANKKKSNVREISNFLKEKYGFKSLEKSRLTLMNLFRKGQILIDVKGRELLCRPNHVTVFSKTKPIDFRTITILDQETEFPVSRIWFTIHKDKGELYLNITESKRSPQGGWETANNIIVPPEAVAPYLELTKHINKGLGGQKNGE